MYTVARGPTRFINRTRRDISQTLDNLECNRDLRRKNSGGSDDSDEIIMSSPRPTFQSSVVNKGSRNSNGGGSGRHSNSIAHHDNSPPLSPGHMEIANHFNSHWSAIQAQLAVQQAEQSRQNGHDDRGSSYKILVYEEKEPHPALKDFKPFELEAWWGKRLYTKLTED